MRRLRHSPRREAVVKLVLFETRGGDVMPGLLTERGVVEIADALPRALREIVEGR